MDALPPQSLCLVSLPTNPRASSPSLCRRLSSRCARHLPLKRSRTATIHFRITSFADPHHLTPIESNLCKKRGEGVPTPLFDPISEFNHCFVSNSHKIIFFAHPHPLIPIESYSCKKQAEGVAGTDSLSSVSSTSFVKHSYIRNPFPFMGLLLAPLDTPGCSARPSPGNPKQQNLIPLRPLPSQLPSRAIHPSLALGSVPSRLGEADIRI
jgi:hypothetical protein